MSSRHAHPKMLGWPGPAHSRFSDMRGLTLTELMVSMALGLVLVGAVTRVFLATQESYLVRESIARVQESGRLAIWYLARDARQAGYSGCATGQVNNLLNTSHAEYDPSLYDFMAAAEGFSAADAPDWLPDHVRGDVLVLKNAAGSSSPDIVASGNTPVNAANLDLTGASHVPQGTVVFVTDCRGGGDLFQNVASPTASTLSRGAAGGRPPGNANPSTVNWSRQYNDNVEILLPTIAVYYIGPSDHDPDIASLRRIDMAAADPVDREVVVGIFDMRVEFGVDTNGDGGVNQYVDVDSVADWSRVAATRIHVIAYTDTMDLLVDEAQTGVPFGTTTFDAPDRRLYRVFSTTVAARNLLL